jgi:hypothetical protein
MLKFVFLQIFGSCGGAQSYKTDFLMDIVTRYAMLAYLLHSHISFWFKIIFHSKSFTVQLLDVIPERRYSLQYRHG